MGIRFADQERVRLPIVPVDCAHNGHLFYILLNDGGQRNRLLAHLKERGIGAMFHYIPLHSAPMGRHLAPDQRPLPVTDSLSQCLHRLPLHCSLTPDDQDFVIDKPVEWLRRQ
jgi:dTDP-4-amino-4,6-dideoxygalactose transaminase